MNSSKNWNSQLSLISSLLAALLLSSTGGFLSANNDNWQNITNYSSTTQITENGDFQFISTSGGLVVIELNSAENDTSYFNRGNSPLPSNIISDIMLDADDVLWIATAKGTIRYKNGDWFDNPKTRAGYFSRPIDPNNSAVFMATGDSLYLFDYEANFAAWKIPHYQADAPRLVLDEENEILYIGLLNFFAESGVVAWKNGDWLSNDEGSNLFAGNYYSAIGMELDDEQNLWVAGDSSYKINNGQLMETTAFTIGAYPNAAWIKKIDDQLFLQLRYTSGSDQVEALLQLLNGEWVEIEPNDLDEEVQAFLFDPLVSVPGPYPLESSQIRDLQIKNEVLYINARTQLFKVENNIWEDLSKKPNFPESADNMIVTSDGTIWVTRGLNLYQYGTQFTQWELFEFPFTFNQAITNLTSDNNGGIWMESNGRLVYINQSIGSVDIYDTTDHGYGSNVFQDIVCLQDGTVWFSGFNGLLHFDGSDWTHYEDIGSESNFTSQLALDADEKLWFRQHSSLGVFLNGGFDYVELPSGNGANSYTSMKFDDNNKLWISGSEELIKFDNGDFTVWNMENSCLADGYQNTLDFDGAGNVWMGSAWTGGISIFNENGIQDLLINGLETREISRREFTLYPNPINVDNRLQIKVELEKNSTLAFSICDLQCRSFGTVKHHQLSKGHWELDLPQLPTGQYFLRLSTNQEVITMPFLIE